MKMSEDAQESLETLWIELVEIKAKSVPEKKLEGEAALKELRKLDLITRKGTNVYLTKRGHAEAKKVIRRHRLYERLFHDILDIEEEDMETSACKFEHIISEEVEESICTLLGHPRICPHGKSIPLGNCCKEGKDTAKRVVTSLSTLEKGKHGTIVYILTQKHKILQKLLAMGVLPGKPVEMIQTYPSYVFQIGQTQIAVDQDLADEIYVRIG